MKNFHAALDNIAAKLEVESDEIEDLGQLTSQIKEASSLQRLQEILESARVSQFSPLNHPQIQALVTGLKNQFKQEARRQNLQRIHDALEPVAGAVVAAVGGAVQPVADAVVAAVGGVVQAALPPGPERVPEPFDQYPILIDGYDLPYTVAIHQLCREYGELYKVKPGPIPETYRWAPDPAERSRLQAALLGLQDEVIRYFLFEMVKLGTNKENIDQFIDNNEAMLDSIALRKPVSKYEKIMRIYYDLREMILQRHEENISFTANNHKSLPTKAIDDLRRAVGVQTAYVEELIEIVRELGKKFELANNKGSREMTAVVNQKAAHVVEYHHRRRVIEILTKLIAQQTIPVLDYSYLEMYFKDDHKKDLLGWAKYMITIEPGSRAIDESVLQDHSQFTAESLRKLIISISGHLQQMTASLLQTDRYTPAQRLSLARLHLYILARVLPSLAIVSTERMGEASIGYVIHYQRNVYQLLDILSGKVSLFESISREYLAMLEGVKAASQLALNDFTNEISELIASYRAQPSAERAASLVEKLFHHKDFTNDYSRVFNDDELGFLNPIQYGDARLVDQEGVLLKLFSDYEKAIKHYMANNQYDSPELKLAVVSFAELRRAVFESGYTYSFTSHLNEAVLGIQKFAAAKRIIGVHRLGVVDQVYVISTFKGILKFDHIYREGIARILKLECESKDDLMKICLERLINNKKLVGRDQWRTFCDEIHAIIQSQVYYDPALKVLHQRVFTYSEDPPDTLSLGDLLTLDSMNSNLTHEQCEAIMLIIKNNPKIVNIDFGRFYPLNFFGTLVNNFEHIHTYRFNYKNVLVPQLRKGIILQPTSTEGGEKYYRSRFKPESLPAPSQSSRTLAFFKRSSKAGASIHNSSLLLNLRSDPSQFFANLAMLPREVFILLFRDGGSIEFKEFDSLASTVYDAHQPGNYFLAQMVVLACDNQHFDLAAEWIAKLPQNSVEFIRGCFDFFRNCPSGACQKESALLGQFVVRLQNGYSSLLHTDIQFLLEKLLKLQQEVVPLEILIGLFKAYLRSLELLNEYNNELVMSKHFQFIKHVLSREELREEILRVLRLEPVFYSDYSLDYLLNDCVINPFNQSLVTQVNSQIVSSIERDFVSGNFASEFQKFSQDMAIMVTNPPCNNPLAFVNGLIHYMANYAARDLAFNKKFSGYISFIEKHKIKIPAELEGAFISRITQLPLVKIKQAEPEIFSIIKYVYKQNNQGQIRRDSEEGISAYEQALIDLRAKVLENRLHGLYGLVMDEDEEWVELEVDKRLPELLKLSSSPIKVLYLYFFDKHENAQNGNGSYFAGRYDSLLKQMGKLDILMNLLETLIALPQHSTVASKNVLYRLAIHRLKGLDKRPGNFIRNIIYYETSVVTAVRSLQSWHQTDTYDFVKLQQLKNFRQELTSHYGYLLEQMVMIYLQHLPTNPENKRTDVTRLLTFLTQARSATRDPAGKWSERLLIQAKSMPTSSLSLFNREIDLFFQKLSENRQLLNYTSNYTIERLQAKVGNALRPTESQRAAPI